MKASGTLSNFLDSPFALELIAPDPLLVLPFSLGENLLVRAKLAFPLIQGCGSQGLPQTSSMSLKLTLPGCTSVSSDFALDQRNMLRKARRRQNFA
jgi:hypothetical protein